MTGTLTLRHTAASAILVLLTVPSIVGCTAGTNAVQSPTTAITNEVTDVLPEVPAEVEVSPTPVDTSATQENYIHVLESGGGLDPTGNFAWVSAMVEHNGYTGEFATVLFNVYNQDDKLIASQEQVEQLGTSGTAFPIGTQVQIPEGETAGRVEAIVSVSDYGLGAEPLPIVEPYSSSYPDARFEIINPTNEDWSNPRISVICRDDAGAIVGGGMDFPTSVPANGHMLSTPYLIVDDSATECQAYLQLSTF